MGEKAHSWFGYMGQILRVDLTKHKFAVEPLEKDFAEKFVGGRGFGAKILFDEVPKGTAPLGPNNKRSLQ